MKLHDLLNASLDIDAVMIALMPYEPPLFATSNGFDYSPLVGTSALDLEEIRDLAFQLIPDEKEFLLFSTGDSSHNGEFKFDDLPSFSYGIVQREDHVSVELYPEGQN